ncbi:hypothetical protein DH2020_011280 [Rehmannia glutinosa]|uniref:YTH domain-containing family protein n=1 Tax=Rehmannia glutinosa TaxID=99300 RepID=A0ABR0XCZ2_REHGL
MSGEKNIEASELIVPGPISDPSVKLSEKEMGKEGIQSNSVSSVSAVGDAMSGIQVVDQPPASEQGVYYPPPSCYDYYYPGYNGTFGQPDDQGFYNAAGGPYTQPCSYGSDAFPCYSYDSTYSGNVSTGTAARSGSVKPVMGPSGSGKSNGYHIPKTNTNFSSKALPFNSKVQQSSNFSKSIYQNQSLKPLNKLGSSFQTTGLMKGYNPASKFSSFTNRNPVLSLNTIQYKGREILRNADLEALTELTRGPRSDSRNNSPKLAAAEVESPGLAIETDNTPNGNKKLDAAFREADAKTSETGTKCPVFLFFRLISAKIWTFGSLINGMVFPIKWHIIKDVPNTLLRHIILENNENRPVTYSRDTQEIGLKQGLEMLGIFKNYSERTSVLDDFNFYENREKSLKAKRNAKPASQTNGPKNGDYKKQFEAGEGTAGEQSAKTSLSDASSLISSLTKNLSLNSQPLKSSI